ncbi:MAG: hypothetical protein AAGL99_14355 [Pseudomonadota bacterium]
MARHQLILLSLAVALGACDTTTESQKETDAPVETISLEAQRLQISEEMIDAFYSFDAERLSPYLIEAERGPRILWYQGWAEGGNYKIVKRTPCSESESPEKVVCPITVEDDPVLALGSDFKVTDTFTISFDNTTIINVETSSNDQPIYYQASAWVRENMPEVMEGPCQGFFDGGPTPGDCARAMADGYGKFAASEDFPGL